jgi:hypothetical protein
MDFLQYIKGKEEQAAPVREGLLLSSLAILRAAEKLLRDRTAACEIPCSAVARRSVTSLLTLSVSLQSPLTTAYSSG